MENTNYISCRPEEASTEEKVSQAFRRVMDDQGYSLPDEAMPPIRREELPDAIRSALLASESNTDKITGRFIGRLYDRILGRLEG